PRGGAGRGRRRLVGRPDPGEDHPAGGRLQDAGDGHGDGAVDVAAPVLHHHHGAVVEVAHALVRLLAVFDDGHLHRLTGADDRLQRVGEVVEVEDTQALDAGQLDEAPVDVGGAGDVGVEELADHVRAVLQPVDHGEAAAAPGAAHRVAGVGDALQLLEDEAGDDQAAGDEPGGDDVEDAAVDEHAGVDQHGRSVLGGRAVVGDHAAIRAGGRGASAAGLGEHRGDVDAAAHPGVNADVHEGDGEGEGDEVADPVGDAAEQHRDQRGDDQPDEEPEGAADQLAGGGGLQGALQPDEGLHGEQRAGQRTAGEAGGSGGEQRDQ